MSGIRVQKDFRGLNALIRSVAPKMDDLGDTLSDAVLADIIHSYSTSPSAPGDPPGIDTGDLMDSMDWEPGRRYRWYIGDLNPSGDYDGYLIHLELGTTRMAARPSIVPMFEHWRRNRLKAFIADYGLLK